MIDGHWLPIRDADPRALALVGRHYSEQIKKRRATGRAVRGFVGPGEKMVLMTRDCRAVCIPTRASWCTAKGCRCFRRATSSIFVSISPRCLTRATAMRS